MEIWYTKAKRLLRQKRITMDALGERLGVGKASISLKLNGKQVCTVKEVIIIASMLDITIDELCSGDPDYLVSSKVNEFATMFESLNAEQQLTIEQVIIAISNKE